MVRGAKKGQNRFKNAQQALIKERESRIKEAVVPKVKTLLDLTYFKSKTKFQELCAEVFNQDLPVNMKKITRKTIGSEPYWNTLGVLYYSRYTEGNETNLEKLKKSALDSFKASQEKEDKDRQVSMLTAQNEALKKALGEAKLIQRAPSNNDSNESLKDDIDNLICVIDFLIKATDGIVKVDHSNNTITNFADDLNGTLSAKLSKTYFKHIGG